MPVEIVRCQVLVSGRQCTQHYLTNSSSSNHRAHLAKDHMNDIPELVDRKPPVDDLKQSLLITNKKQKIEKLSNFDIQTKACEFLWSNGILYHGFNSTSWKDFCHATNVEYVSLRL